MLEAYEILATTSDDYQEFLLNHLPFFIEDDE